MPVISLKPEHLPANIAEHLADWHTKAGAAHAAAQHASRTHITQRGDAQQEADQAATAAREALGALEHLTATSNRAILDSAAGNFQSHLEKARAALEEAAAQMRQAAAAASLYATAQARPGRRVLDINGAASERSQARIRCMLVISEIRDVVGLLPEDVDG